MSIKKKQLEEIRRCARDPIYFLNTYVKISHPTKGLISFKTYEFQNECVNAFIDHKFTIINKSRQLGLSTLTAAYAAWLLLFHRNKEVMIMATKLKIAINFIRKVKTCIRNLPDWLVISKIAEDNKQSLVFSAPSNSRIEAIPTAPDAGRSEALSLLIVDEAAHVAGFEELWKGLFPTLSTGGRSIIISTPNGVGNWFHKLWADAQDKANAFHAIELPWTCHPERDEEWFKQQTINMSAKAISQELLCDFLASGDTYLDSTDIDWVGKCVKQPIRREGPERNVWVWCDAVKDPSIKYIIAADVGRGDSNDFSTFCILCVNTGEIVAEYRGKLRPDLFAALLLDYGKKYNNALICPEKNSYGNHVIIELCNKGYTNIYSRNIKDPIVGTYVSQDKLKDLGFDTQRDSRKKIIAKLEEVIRNKQLKSYSVRFYNELKTFVINGDKPQAQKNCHDDIVMATAIASWIFDTSEVNGQFATELNNKMLQAFSVNVNSFDDMANNGNEVQSKAQLLMPQLGTINSGIEQQKRRGIHIDISWLYK